MFTYLFMRNALDESIDVIFALCMFICEMLLYLLIVEGIDSIGSDRYTEKGYIISKHYTAPYTTMIMSGKVMISQYHSAEWEVRVKAGTYQGKCSVSEYYYHDTEEKQEITATLTTGLLFKSNIHCKGVK